MLIDRLKSLPTNGVSYDTETFLIRAGNLTPDIVLGSVAWWDGAKIQGALLDKQQALELFAQVVDDITKVIVGANIAFDLGVLVREFAKRGVDILPYIFLALMGEHTEHMTGIHDGRIYDIQHAEALNAIAIGMLGKDPRTGAPLKGRYSQDQCVQLTLNRDNAKVNDMYRLRYGEFDNVPLDQLPPEARQYPVDDSVNAFEVSLAQTGFLPKVGACHTWGPQGACISCGATGAGTPCWIREPHQNAHDLAAQTATAFCLHMGAAWGFKIDQKYVDLIEDYSTHNWIEGLKPYIEAGLVRPDGTEDRSKLKRLVALAYGSSGECPTCKGTGKVPSPANPKSKIICFQMDADQQTKLKTCDGTGLILGPNVPRSEKEGIGYGRSFLIESGDEFLMGYAEVMEDKKTRDVYVPFLRTGRLCISCDHHGTAKDPHAEGCAMAGYKDIPLTLRPNPILETGRVSYDGAIMLLPRKPGFQDTITKQYIPSLRECFIARDGYGFSSEDFKAGETFTHAQSCIWLLGYSDLATALLNDIDPHGAIAASTLGVSYQEWFKRRKEPLFKAARQAAKPFTFGKPTGMSSVRLVLSNRAQGPDTPSERGPSWIDDGTWTGKKIRGYKGLRFCILMNGSPTCGDVMVNTWGRREGLPPTCKACLECADHLGKIWLKQWRENQPYYDLNDGIVNEGMIITEEALERWPWLKKVYRPGQKTEPGQVMAHWSGRLRGGMDFTTTCNNWFQVLLADITKLAYRLASRECQDSTIKVPSQLFHNSLPSAYAGMRSPLYGSHALAPFHDELFMEHPLAMMHDGATRTSEIARDVFRYICPDVKDKVGADPTIMPRWYKNAEEIRDENGRLVMWVPKGMQ
jgi:hypothetical protein